jgi:hypothetical protein
VVALSGRAVRKGSRRMSQQSSRSRVECAGRTLLLGCAFVVMCACAEADSCPAISSRTVEPAGVETSAELLASTPGIVQLVVSDGGLYWHDGASISALPPGQASVLYALAQAAAAMPAPFAGEFRTITGLLEDADHLYWGESTAYTGGFVVDYSPPGRLLSMPKTGGPVQVLLELADRAVIPVAVDDARVIVQLSGVAAGYHSFSKLDQTLAPLVTPALYETSRVVGDEIYWTDQGEDSPQLFRSRIDGTERESIASSSRPRRASWPFARPSAPPPVPRHSSASSGTAPAPARATSRARPSGSRSRS